MFQARKKRVIGLIAARNVMHGHKEERNVLAGKPGGQGELSGKTKT